MANISINTTSFIDGILPVYGNPRCNIPVWNEGEKMFISDEYQSAKGNWYYKGLRFSDRLAIVEKVGLFHSFKYTGNTLMRLKSIPSTKNQEHSLVPTNSRRPSMTRT